MGQMNMSKQQPMHCMSQPNVNLHTQQQQQILQQQRNQMAQQQRNQMNHLQHRQNMNGMQCRTNNNRLMMNQQQQQQAMHQYQHRQQQQQQQQHQLQMLSSVPNMRCDNRNNINTLSRTQSPFMSMPNQITPQNMGSGSVASGSKSTFSLLSKDLEIKTNVNQIGRPIDEQSTNLLKRRMVMNDNQSALQNPIKKRKIYSDNKNYQK